jgi:hypothetical protein
VVGGEQTKLQTLSSFFSVRHFPALQKFLHEITLICRESLPASKKVKEGVAVLDEYRTKSFRCLGDHEWTGMHRVRTAGAVIEERETGRHFLVAKVKLSTEARRSEQRQSQR